MQTEPCQNPDCEVKNYNFKHPRICKYFRDYRRHKFGKYCCFRHEVNTLEKVISDNQTTNDRLGDIEKILKEKNNLENKIGDIDKKTRQQQFTSFKSYLSFSSKLS